MRQELGLVELDVVHDGRARLGDHQLRRILLDMFQVAANRKFGPKAHIEGGRDSQRGEPTIEVQVLAGKRTGDGGAAMVIIGTPAARSWKKRVVSSLGKRAWWVQALMHSPHPMHVS